MDTEFHLPWENSALEALLRKIIQIGETTKVDFKSQFGATTTEQDAELLKDISALANTYDSAYQNHGFIVIGVTGNTLTHTNFSQTADALQARVDELVKNYIEPFVPTQVRIFGTIGAAWGVIVVPPSRMAPHVFVKDIHKRSRGDIFVRRGTITDKALPGDYARFFRAHLEEHTFEMRQQIEDLKRDVTVLKKRPLSSRRRSNESSRQALSNQPLVEAIPSQGASFELVGEGLIQAIENSFVREEDPIANGLLKEARRIQKFLISDEIPWALSPIDKESGTAILAKLEGIASPFWKALWTLSYRDDSGKYDDAVLRALIPLLQVSEAPTSISYTNWGVGVRYVPLLVSLYILFICGGLKKRYSFLKRLAKLSLARRSRYEERMPIPYALFHIRRADPIFQTQHAGYPDQRWCDAVGMYVRRVLDRMLNIDDPQWDKEAAFFVGEFLLCLTPIDVLDSKTKTVLIGHPSAGIYLYFDDAGHIITQFLRENGKSLAQIFDRPLKEILKNFDENAEKLISGSCFGNGFVRGASALVFPEEPSGSLQSSR